MGIATGVDGHFGHRHFGLGCSSVGHFRQAFFGGERFGQIFFIKSIFYVLFFFYFHKIMNGKIFIVHHFYQHFSLEKKIYCMSFLLKFLSSAEHLSQQYTLTEQIQSIA